MGSLSSSVVRDPAFRRQFILGPEFSDLLPGWERHRLADGFMLSTHPDLPVTRVAAGDLDLVLLGFVLDPRHPDRDDQTILDGVVSESTTLDQLLAAFDPLAGRWAAICLVEDQVRVFHDAAGLRQVYHGRDEAGALWCGSSPGLISRLAGHVADVETREAMVRDDVLDTNWPHFWPGTGSAYLGIDRLLPNHQLDARTGQVERFWPRSPLRSITPEVAIASCADALTGAMAAAASRYPLSLAITAGLDSRLLLAASRGCAEQLTFYTLMKPGMTPRSADVRVPRKMLGELGFRHQVITVQPASQGPVATAIYDTFSPFHQATANSAQALSDDPPRPDGNWVTVNGNVCEIARCAYPVRVAVTPESLAWATNMSSSAYATEQFGAWLTSATPAIEASGINAWDQFYWEQRIGGWLATVRTEFDVVEEGVTPYNSRALLETMLGVDEPLRREQDWIFHHDLIAHLWPQLLDYPINPSNTLRYRLRAARPIYKVAKSALRRMGGPGGRSRG